MQSIDKIMAMGGNYLLNVGPKPDGTIAEENIEALKTIGAWYHSVKESFGDAVPASDMIFRDEIVMEGSSRRMVRDEVLVTRRGNALYIHLYKDPQSRAVVLKPLHGAPRKATLLNDGRELETAVDMIP